MAFKSKLSAVAVNEFLHSAKGRVVRFLFMRHQDKGGTKFGVQAIGCVAHDGQTTALQRAVFGKRGDNDVAPGLDRSQNTVNIGLTIFLAGQKVKHCPIVSNI